MIDRIIKMLTKAKTALIKMPITVMILIIWQIKIRMMIIKLDYENLKRQKK